MSDQRAHERYTVWLPITVENPSGHVQVICRDGSAGGVLISGRDGVALHLEVGEAVMVSLPQNLPRGDEEPLFGRVVRVEGLEEGERRVAIEFIRPVPELEAMFRRTSSLPPPMR